MRQTSYQSRVPSWVIPEDFTAQKDAASPSEYFLGGIQEASRWTYSGIEANPFGQIFNFFSKGHFAWDLKRMYAIIHDSGNTKAEVQRRLCARETFKVDEYRLWECAPLQTMAFKVGKRVLSGLQAIAVATGDWRYYDEFYEWFNREWLPKADAAALLYSQISRLITRTESTSHIFLPHLDSLRDNLISLNELIWQEHPEISRYLCEVDKEYFYFEVTH